MYDNHSNDGSQDVARNLGFEVRTFGFANHLDDQCYLDVKNHCWKEERENGQGADYVIVCDADEFVIPDILKGTCPKVQGYNMISDTMPVNDIFEVKVGAKSENYSKQAIFSPKHVEEINFWHGCHKNSKSGLITDEGFCRLFHFRQIGGVHRMLDRHELYRPRLSDFNKKHGMGAHYGLPEWTEEEIFNFNEGKKTEWATLQKQAHELW